MKILGIESTCDETSIGVVADGRKVLLNLVASSVDLYKVYGGVVPEIAAREQLKVIIPLLDEARNIIDFNLLDGIAVSYGPGLVGSLLIGVETAKTLAVVYNKPLYAINHLIGHVYSCFLEAESNTNTAKFPLVALIVSGGHTDLLLMRDHGQYRWLGGTRDDACGEAFDKVAKLLGLSYPGGPEIEKVSKRDDGSETFNFPRPMIDKANYDFSFSGLKTAVSNVVKSAGDSESKMYAIAQEFQNAVVDVLVKKTISAAKTFEVRSIIVGGGVSANSMLRKKMANVGMRDNFKIYFPKRIFSVDNGAMIAAAAFYHGMIVDPMTLQANPSLHF